MARRLSSMASARAGMCYVTHAALPEMAEYAKEALMALFPEIECEIYPLTPAFITQGGPGCVAIQTVRMI